MLCVANEAVCPNFHLQATYSHCFWWVSLNLLACPTLMSNIAPFIPSDFTVNLVVFNDDCNCDCGLAPQHWLLVRLCYLSCRPAALPHRWTPFSHWSVTAWLFGSFVLKRCCRTCNKCHSGNKLQNRLARHRSFSSYKLDICSKYESKIVEKL